MLEIECKQYQAPDRRNFTDALRDYASSRPKANVVLVDYGPVSDRVRDGIISAIDPPLRDRCQVIRDLRPPSSAPPGHEARAGLTAAVHEAIGAEVARLLPSDLPARIDLTWEAAPPAVDLDLHLEVLDGGNGRDHVSFRQPEIGDPIHARLLADVLGGPRSETLLIERWLDTTYRLWVHRFDGGELAVDGKVAGADARHPRLFETEVDRPTVVFDHDRVDFFRRRDDQRNTQFE